MDDLVIATANPHKVEEIGAIFAELGLRGVRLRSLREFAPIPEPAETGMTFEANATIKALWYAQHTACACLADDSGLEVDALAGRPGVISSHFSTDGHETGMMRQERDAANNQRLLRELQGVEPARRGARFVCVMVVQGAPRSSLASRGRLIARGEMSGRIGEPGQVPRGAHGFGYDPLFLVAPDFQRTGAELAPAEKNAISHRAHAARALARLLDSR